MILAVSLIFLSVISLLVMGAMENNLLNQKMAAAFQAEITALNTAEAGLIATEAQINGQTADISALKGQLDYHISVEMIDDCQQHIFTILSTASYQNARVQLTSAYLKARDPPLPNCPTNQLSHRLWWQQLE